MKKIFYILFFILIIGIIACTPTKGTMVQNNDKNVQTKKIKYPIEKIVFTGLDDSLYKLSDFKGHVVILDFWASWCGPCKRSIPFYNRMYEKYADRGLIVIGLDVNEPKEKIEESRKSLKISYRLGLSNNALNKMFQIQGIPAMFLFDKNGNFVETFVGYAPELDTTLERLILENL